jgi:cytochrome c biogenesis protein CcdA
MESWIHEALSTDRIGPALLSAAFLLGTFGALGSCCTLPVIGAVTGWSGSRGEGSGRRQLLLAGSFFLVGTFLALVALGAVTAFVGQVAGAALGRYWRLAAGFAAVLFGLASLRLVPFRMPTIPLDERAAGNGAIGAMLFGITIGGASTACAVGCNPLLAAILGSSAMKGAPLFGAVVLAFFALGYSLPLAAALVGLGFGLGRLAGATRRVARFVNAGAGLLLIGVGFYMLATS